MFSLKFLSAALIVVEDVESKNLPKELEELLCVFRTGGFLMSCCVLSGTEENFASLWEEIEEKTNILETKLLYSRKDVDFDAEEEFTFFGTLSFLFPEIFLGAKGQMNKNLPKWMVQNKEAREKYASLFV